MVALEVEETRLERTGDRVVAVGTGDVSRIACDNVVFAVGDRVDESVGLPYRDGLYVTVARRPTNPGAAYEVWDPERQQPVPLTFVVGWARRASDGVVGRARLDAETGAKHVLSRLAARPSAVAGRGRPPCRVRDRARAEPGRDARHLRGCPGDRSARAGPGRVLARPELKFGTDREMLDLLRG